MALQNKIPQLQSPGIMSYDFVDIAEGTGIVKFFIASVESTEQVDFTPSAHTSTDDTFDVTCTALVKGIIDLVEVANSGDRRCKVEIIQNSVTLASKTTTSTDEDLTFDSSDYSDTIDPDVDSGTFIIRYTETGGSVGGLLRTDDNTSHDGDYFSFTNQKPSGESSDQQTIRYRAGTFSRILTRDQVYSNDIEISETSNNTTSYEAETTVFNLPRTIRGTGYFSCPFITGTSSSAQIKAQVVVVDKDNNETAITDALLTRKTGASSAEMALMTIPFTETTIKGGESLRLKFDFIVTSGGQTVATAHDPQNRDGTNVIPSSQDLTSAMTLYIPFRIDIN